MRCGICSSLAILIARPPALSLRAAALCAAPSSATMDVPPPSPTIRVVPTFASPVDHPCAATSPTDPARKPLSLWPGLYHSPVTNALWHARTTIAERLCPPSTDGPPQTTLLTRKSSDSRVSILYNFSTDFILREQYRNAWNQCRIGKIMEDLDALAGTIAVKHCSDDDSTTRPLVLVTASVEKISIRRTITLDTDVKMSGAVTWVGRSSMEIRIELKQPATGPMKDDESVAIIANFTFVARDSKSGKSASVNRLAPQTEEEKILFEEAELRDAKRKKHRLQQQHDAIGSYKIPEDNKKLQALLAEGRILCDMPALADKDSILIQETRLENAHICEPQQRNIHGRIFGGYLIRRAYELAFSTCYIFCGHRPLFLEVDRIDFLRPVDVGDFLRFKSCVLYTEFQDSKRPFVHVEVVAHVTRPEFRTSEVSNTFYFTFTVNPDVTANNTLTIRKVFPATEEEARRVLQRFMADHDEHA